MSDIFRSERLLYRASEGPADDEFFKSVTLDLDVIVDAFNFLPRPWSSVDAMESRKWISRGSLVFVVICKTPDFKSESAIEKDDKITGDGKEDKKPPPTPIGFLQSKRLP
jgi:hypothetical protein